MSRNTIAFHADDHAQTAAHSYGNSERRTRTLEVPAPSGKRILELPRHNGDEGWRDTTPTAITASHAWLDALEAATRARRASHAESEAQTLGGSRVGLDSGVQATPTTPHRLEMDQ